MRELESFMISVDFCSEPVTLTMADKANSETHRGITSDTTHLVAVVVGC